MIGIDLSPEEFFQLMPHKEPMLMIDGVIEADPELDSGTAFYIPGRRPMAGLNPDGSLPVHIVLEVMAQGCAAILGICRLLRNEPPMDKGLLLSVRGFKTCCTGSLPQGKKILITVKRELLENGFAVLTAEARFSDPPEEKGDYAPELLSVARGRFSVWSSGAETDGGDGETGLQRI